MVYGIIAVVIILLAVASWFIGNYFYNFGINAKVDKSALFTPAQRTAEEQARLDASHKQDADFIAAHPAEELHLPATHGKAVLLRAQVFRQPQPTAKWAIVVHGYTSEGVCMLREACGFYAGGYNVLLPDLRGHGKSEGDYIGMGWPDHYDIIDWVNYLVRQDTACEILLYGVSMGAATVMNVSGEALPANVKAIIEDCGYTSIRDIFSYHLGRLFHLPAFPLLYIADLTIRLRAGYSILSPGPIKQVAKSKTPILFIHGDKDTFVPYFMLDKVYTAASCPKQRLVIENAGHALSEYTNPALYWQTIWQFVQPYIQQCAPDTAEFSSCL